jgi:hypothetical protein
MRQFRFFLTLALLGALPIACSKEYTPTQEITDVREANAEEQAAAEMSTQDRMRMQPVEKPDAAPATSDAAAPAASAPSAAAYLWNAPEGWEELPSTSMRLANFQVKGHPEVECYFTVLPGDGGGLSENVNRWRRQFGKDPIDDAAVTALPIKPLLMKNAYFLDIEGAFTGMGTEAFPDYRMYGLILIDAGQAYFVKMTGPKAVVDNELPNFTTFCQSIREASKEAAADEYKLITAEDETPAAPAPVEPAAEAAPTPSVAGGPLDESALAFDTPEGWTRGADRPMRSVSFTIGEATECYVAILGGGGGGLESNLNRWRGQMGQPPLDAAAIAALETVDIAGVASPIIEIEGDYTGMTGGTHQGYLMLGAARMADDQALFVKLTGPKDEAAAQVDNFKAFCASLR